MVDTVTLVFKDEDDVETPVVASVGASVMQAAVMADIAGIEGECGGCLSCATCHVVPADKYGEPSDDEAAMLDFAEAPRQAASRLGCQITVTPQMNGAIFRIPRP